MPANYNPVLAENVSATTAGVLVPGGRMLFKCKATGYGTVTLQYLLPDGVTWAACGSDTTLTADGGGIVELPGQQTVRVLIATATAVYANLEAF